MFKVKIIVRKDGTFIPVEAQNVPVENKKK